MNDLARQILMTVAWAIGGMWIAYAVCWVNALLAGNLKASVFCMGVCCSCIIISFVILGIRLKYRF